MMPKITPSLTPARVPNTDRTTVNAEILYTIPIECRLQVIVPSMRKDYFDAEIIMIHAPKTFVILLAGRDMESPVAAMKVLLEEVCVIMDDARRNYHFGEASHGNFSL